MRAPAWIAPALLCTAACSSEYHPEYHPQTSYSVHQSVSYPTTIFEVGAAGTTLVSTSATEAQPESEPEAPAVDPGRVRVLESTQLDRPSDVIGVVDVRVSGGARD